jgi:4-diphosphocytidyl-2-C-methyl-D-erythritol kinase
LSASSEAAFAKVNLALHVREKRSDGYHRIETVFAFCEEGDELEAEASEDVSVSLIGPAAGGIDRSDNLVTKAAEAIRQAEGDGKGAAITLRKMLPVASGLGGGSADAAATLRLLNRLWKLHLPAGRLEEIAGQLGADVRACVRSETMRGEGKGDELAPIHVPVSGTPILLVNPRVELPTADVFAAWDGIDRGPLGDWRKGRNDLETAAKSLVPQIGAILAWLSAQRGADCVRMSGSGATCFALFEGEEQRDRAAEAVPREWWRLATRLR